jgi:hypothetical protein
VPWSRDRLARRSRGAGGSAISNVAPVSGSFTVRFFAAVFVAIVGSFLSTALPGR